MSDYKSWKSKILDKKVVYKLSLMSKEKREINFSQDLAFGTAGMRGVMELGTNCVNVLTVSKLAKSVAEYLNKTAGKKSVVVCFDTRLNSKHFSRIFANMLAYNNIKVFLFKKFAPTPLCVFATTKYNANLGVMITASHNNKAYNGIKLYDENGIQINKQIQEQISEIYENTNEIDAYNFIYNKKLNKNIQFIGKNISKLFVDRQTDYTKKNLRIVYTPLNGTGYYCVKRILKQNGFSFKTPKVQKHGNGFFTTCPYPNPEFEEAFNRSIRVANSCNADIIVATDPDADRIGVMVKHDDKYVKLSGNEVGYIFANYMMRHNKSGFVVTSVVTSPLIDKICKDHNVELYKTLTGFMSLGTAAKQLQDKYGKDKYILAYEESCGYAVRNDYYDKDGVFATLKICEIAQFLKNKNKTLIDYLNEIYEKYGYMATIGDNVMYEGQNSLSKMNKKIDEIRNNPFNEFMGAKLIKRIDFQNDDTGLEKQNFLQFVFEKFSFVLRPSGTEPKLKIYLFYMDKNMQEARQNALKVLYEIKTTILK